MNTNQDLLKKINNKTKPHTLKLLNEAHNIVVLKCNILHCRLLYVNDLYQLFTIIRTQTFLEKKSLNLDK